MLRHSIKILVFIFFCHSKSFGQIKLSGTFVGLLRISEWTDENGKYRYYGDDFDPKAQWYHETVLTIKNDSAWAEKYPVRFWKGKKYYSASDGSFYYYHGVIQKIKDKLAILLVLKKCDYCPMKRKFTPPVIIKTEDTLIINNDTSKIHLNMEVKGEEYDYPEDTKYLTLFIEPTTGDNLLVNNKTIFKRRKLKR